MIDPTSSHIQVVREILSSLAKVRLDRQAWLDSESEELGRETQVFKIGECLYPFYLAASANPGEIPLTLPPQTLFDDTKTFFKHVDKHGFFPSPYSQIPEAVDQYTDFAAFSLMFCTLAHDYWEHDQKRGRQLTPSAKATARRALEFLLAPQHCLRDDDGCRWAGTTEYKRMNKGIEELYTNTFFTATAAIALARTLEHPILDLSPVRRDEVRNFIRDAGRWIVGRFDGEFITGDEPKSNRALLHTTWGIRMLMETYDVQEQAVRKYLPSVTNAYAKTLKAKIDKDESLVQQEYLTVLSKDVSAPLYYEDRSGVGGILIALALLRRQTELEELLDKLRFPVLFEQVLNSVMILRNLPTGLWYSHGLILSIHSYLAEAFLMLSKRGLEAGKRIEVSGHMVRAAVREALSDDAIVAGIQQAVYQRLLRLVESSKQEQLIDAGIAQWPSDTKAEGEPGAGEVRPVVSDGSERSSRSQRKPRRKAS